MVSDEISDEPCSDQDAFSDELHGKRHISANSIEVFLTVSVRELQVFSQIINSAVNSVQLSSYRFNPFSHRL
jgi:hypothetical protein